MLGVDLADDARPVGEPDARALLRARVEAEARGAAPPRWESIPSARERAELEALTAGRQGSL